GWNKGLTKETDPRVAVHAKKLKGRPSWNKGRKCPQISATNKGRLLRGPVTLEERVRSSRTIVSDEQLFVVGKWRSSATLKARILLRGVEEICVACGLMPTWAEKPLTLQLDHANGDSKDNRFENLRFLCPNCHSQTSTFGGKRNAKTKGLYASLRAAGKPLPKPRKSKRQRLTTSVACRS
ncbi:hypothetical protein LCGC14_2970170, partial [marine sediment metagenome]